jgi:GR25 family glycosyltransferase involved in LPS biosynthesis
MNQETYDTINPEPDWSLSIDLFLFINLKERKDRKQQIIAQFQKIGIPCNKVIRIEAIKSGFRGCTKSHINAVRFAFIHHCKKVMICEDDWIVINDDFNTIMNSLDSVNIDFNVFMVGMTPIILKHNVNNIYNIHQSLGMGCYILSCNYFSKLLHIFNEALQKIIPHDLITQIYQKMDKWYGFYPAISRQSPGWSDIEQKTVDYGYLEIDAQMLTIVS